MHARVLFVALATVALPTAAVCLADDIHSKLGALSYLNESQDTIGITIPAWHEGFGPDVSIPEDLRDRFDTSLPHPENDVLAVPLGRAANDLRFLVGLNHLRWVKYCGMTSRILSRAEINKRETAKILVLEETLREVPTLRSLAIYDSALPKGVLERLMKHNSLEAILLIGCFTEEENGEMTRTPNARIMIEK